uniref:Uncharacterized protein n=1 Tax=Anguilla anguilla TaxID=7936 RepID=A0A0E9QGK0_ANGAN
MSLCYCHCVIVLDIVLFSDAKVNFSFVSH